MFVGFERRKHLVKLFSHLANNLVVLHVVVHVHCYTTLAARAVDEELDEVKHCNVPVRFVRLDPVIDKRLQNKGACALSIRSS